jgi:FlaA1/EpsC-like NDP-sugar epimerase
MAIVDAFLITAAFTGAVLLRFEGGFDWVYGDHFTQLFVPLLAMRLAAFLFCGLYRWSFVYASVHDFLNIIKGVALGTILYLGCLQLIGQKFSWSIVLIETGLIFLFATAFRYSYRLLIHAQREPHAAAKKVLIYGAGDSGEMIVREMKKNPDMGFLPVGFVDDDNSKHVIRLHNLKVLGHKQDLPDIIEKEKVDELIIAIPSASGRLMREVVALCGKKKIHIRKLSPLQDVLAGGFNPKQLAEVDVEDLLNRPPVQLELNEICSYLQGKIVLVTGGAGSIGSELCRQVLRFGVKKLVILDHNENKSHLLSLELGRHPNADKNAEILVEIADIRDETRIAHVFREHEPEVIFHAAAHKHVPLMEAHPDEAVKNNVFGTYIVANAAHKIHAERFIMVSTDKAVNPQSVMGITKRMAEQIVQDFARHSTTKFNSVRFGNVLGSDGSVIPIFKEQIARGGPVTVTHPETSRYFMTIPEAVQLILQAAALGTGGEVFILDMGEPVRVLDLARNLITLSGYVPERDIEITFTGLRPGEKMSEELLTADEGIMHTRHHKVFRVRSNGNSPQWTMNRLQTLRLAAEANDRDQVRRLLKEFVRHLNETRPLAPEPSTESPASGMERVATVTTAR